MPGGRHPPKIPRFSWTETRPEAGARSRISSIARCACCMRSRAFWSFSSRTTRLAPLDFCRAGMSCSSWASCRRASSTLRTFFWASMALTSSLRVTSSSARRTAKRAWRRATSSWADWISRSRFVFLISSWTSSSSERACSRLNSCSDGSNSTMTSWALTTVPVGLRATIWRAPPTAGPMSMVERAERSSPVMWTRLERSPRLTRAVGTVLVRCTRACSRVALRPSAASPSPRTPATTSRRLRPIFTGPPPSGSGPSARRARRA